MLRQMRQVQSSLCPFSLEEEEDEDERPFAPPPPEAAAAVDRGVYPPRFALLRMFWQM